MSEFKFACPNCGQHITADSTNSGGQIECPTCYRKIVVPQAPTSADPKFILTAAQADKPKPPASTLAAAGEFVPAPRAKTLGPVMAGALLLLVCAAGGLAFVFRDKLFKTRASAPPRTNAVVVKKQPPPMTVYSVPTNVSWTLDLAAATTPQSPAAGKIHGHGFVSERAILQGGTLTLRQGHSGAADLGVSIRFFVQAGEELSGKTIEIATNRPPPVPKVTLRWKAESQAVTRPIETGYALRVSFGDATAGRISGRIYLATPDEDQSFVGGTFDAEIRKPAPPKPKKPKAVTKKS